jgi:Uncharacterised protein conserved in bacteria (DUF2336)
MASSPDHCVDAVLSEIDRLPASMRETLAAGLVAQLGAPTGLAPRAKERLDRILAGLLPGLTLDSRRDLAKRIIGASCDLPEAIGAIETDLALKAALIADLPASRGPADGKAAQALLDTARSVETWLMAQRPDLTPAAIELFAAAGGAPTARAIAANHALRLPPHVFAALIRRAAGDPALLSALARRTDLASGQVRELIGMAQADLQPRLNEALAQAAAREARQAATDAAIAKERQLRPKTAADETTVEVRAAFRAGSRSLAETVTLLGRTDRVLPAMDILTVLLGLDHDAVLAAVGQVDVEPFEAIGRAAMLGEEAYLALIGGLHRRWRKPMPDRRFLMGRYGRLEQATISARLAALAPREEELGPVEQVLLDIP